MIRFVIWATLKDWLGWRPTEVIGSITGDYKRWKSMKAAYEKEWSLEAAFKEGRDEWERKQLRKEEEEMKKIDTGVNGISAVTIGKIDLTAPTIYFKGTDNAEIMRLEPNGDIYVKGSLVENDKEVVDGMRAFLRGYGLWKEETE